MDDEVFEDLVSVSLTILATVYESVSFYTKHFFL